MAAGSTEYLQGCHLLVATPAAVAEVVQESPFMLSLLDHLRVLAVDEVDACFEQDQPVMELLLGTAVTAHRRRELLAAEDQQQQQLLGGAGAAGGGGGEARVQVVYVGATVQDHHVREGVAEGWLREPVSIMLGGGSVVPSGLQHRFLVCAKGQQLAQAARLLRADLQAAGADAAPARAMVRSRRRRRRRRGRALNRELPHTARLQPGAAGRAPSPSRPAGPAPAARLTAALPPCRRRRPAAGVHQQRGGGQGGV